MQGLTSRLKNKITLYGKTLVKNELGEDDYKYAPIKDLYAEILPYRGYDKPKQGDTTLATTSHKVLIRSSSVDLLEDDMYFVFKNQRYDIDYFNPNYIYRDSIEIFATLIEGVYTHE